MSTNEVRIPLLRIFQELATLRTAAWPGASSKMCAAYLASSWSRSMSNLVNQDNLWPESACDTTSSLVPQEMQNLRVPVFSLPQVGQNISSSCWPGSLGSLITTLKLFMVHYD